MSKETAELCDMCKKHPKGTNDTLCLSCRIGVENERRKYLEYLR